MKQAVDSRPDSRSQKWDTPAEDLMMTVNRKPDFYQVSSVKLPNTHKYGDSLH